MRYSRFGLIAVLVAVEVFIGGAILAVSGVGHGSWSVQAAGLRQVREGDKVFAPIDAGASPHVVIADPGSQVVVTASQDGKVHVTDRSQASGWYFANSDRRQLTVTRTADGVAVERPDGWQFGFFIDDDERTEVALPPSSYVEITGSGSARVTGIRGRAEIHSQDGAIEAVDLALSSPLVVSSQDGDVHLQNVSAPSIDASTEDGAIRSDSLRVGGGRLQTQDGSVDVALSGNLRVQAQTQDGDVYFDGRRVASGDDETSGVYQIGAGGGSLQVGTQDGSIHINSKGAI
jgi:WD40 repeat protein